MRHLLIGKILAFALVLAIGPGSSTLQAAPKKSNSVISGIVQVATTDKKGNIVSIEILVGEEPDTEPYLVANTEKGKELRKHIGDWVVVSGTVSEDELGWKTIDVKKFDLADKYQGMRAPAELALLR